MSKLNDLPIIAYLIIATVIWAGLILREAHRYRILQGRWRVLFSILPLLGVLVWIAIVLILFFKSGFLIAFVVFGSFHLASGLGITFIKKRREFDFFHPEKILEREVNEIRRNKIIRSVIESEETQFLLQKYGKDSEWLTELMQKSERLGCGDVVHKFRKKKVLEEILKVCSVGWGREDEFIAITLILNK